VAGSALLCMRHAGTLGTLSDSAETKSLCDLGTGAGLGVGY
jgi:hypothetical protein